MSKLQEKSAEVIVVADTSRAITRKSHPGSEGPNIKLVPNAAWRRASHALSGTEKTVKVITDD